MIALKCTCKSDDEDFECAGCREHRTLDAAIGVELNLYAFQFPCVVYESDIDDTGPGTVGRFWCGEPGRRLFQDLAKAAGVANPPTCPPWERPLKQSALS
jgi:hypothetical protein